MLALRRAPRARSLSAVFGGRTACCSRKARGVFAHDCNLRGCGRGEPGFANRGGVALVEAWSRSARALAGLSNGSTFARPECSITRAREPRPARSQLERVR